MKTVEIDSIKFRQPKSRDFNRFVIEQGKIDNYIKENVDKADEIEISEARFDMTERLVRSCLIDNTQSEILEEKIQYELGWVFNAAITLVKLIADIDNKHSEIIDESLKG